MNETLDCTNCCIGAFKHQLCDCNGDFCTKYKSIGDENDFMQAVLADRPQGEWEIYVISPFDGEDCRCSECGYTGCAPYWDYCPNCGARMKGADDDN